MTPRDDIYDHLARVYLGKRSQDEEKKKKQFNAWLVINVVVTLIIFASVFYGLTAFLTQKGSSFENNIIFSLYNGPIQLSYDFENSFSPVKSFSLAIPGIPVAKYKRINFSIRSKEEGTPGIVKIVLQNEKNEIASYYIKGVDFTWQKFEVPLEEFQQITDWTNLTDISFVIESWNVNDKKGLILIDNLCFSS